MGLFDRFPWLTDASTSRQEWHGSPPGPNDAGVWGIGNGRVFAHTGMAGPPGSLQGIVGPHYQTEGDHAVEGAFGACWVEVERDSVPVPAGGGRCWRVRGTAIVVTELSLGGAKLRIVDFAPPDVPVLIRSIEWVGAFDADDRLRVRFPSGLPVPDRPRLFSEYRAGQVALVQLREGVGASGAGPAADHGPGGSGGVGQGGLQVVAGPGSLLARIAAVPGRELSVVIAAGLDSDDAERVLQAAGSIPERLEETRRFWSGWLAGTTRVEAWDLRWDHPRGTGEALGDLVEASKISLKLQQSLPGGGAGPMVHFKGTWARDNNGIVRGLLASGALEEARAAIAYYVRAAAWLGEIPNRAPLNAPAHVPLPGDWSRMPVPETEVPSWLVLQHVWWLEAGGDQDLVREHWPFLVRCLDGQAVGDVLRLPFHGDETYLHGALLSVYPERVSWPHGLIAHTPRYRTWSLEATAAWVTAAEGLAFVADLLGHSGEADRFRARAATVRARLEADFWQEHRSAYAPALYPVTGAPHHTPFAPVNAALIWMGYRSGSPERLRRDLSTTLREVGFGRAAPGCPFDVGGTRGMLLWDLLAMESELAPLALAHLAQSASPSGDWAEIHGPGGGPDGGYDLDHPNRLRPWETGIALEAMLRYFRQRERESEPALEDLRPGTTAATGSSRPAHVATGPARYTTALSASARQHATPPARTVRVTCDVDDRDPEGDVTLLEPAALASPREITALLFDPDTGERRVDRLEFASGALTSGRATLRPPAFWRDERWLEGMARFVVEGGVVVGWEGDSPPGT